MVQGTVGFQCQDQVAGQVQGDQIETPLQSGDRAALRFTGCAQGMAKLLGFFHGLLGGVGFSHAQERLPQLCQDITDLIGEQVVMIAHQAADHANAGNQGQGLVTHHGCRPCSPRALAAFIENGGAVITQGKDFLQQAVHLLVAGGVGAGRIKLQLQIGQRLVEGIAGMIA